MTTAVTALTPSPKSAALVKVNRQERSLVGWRFTAVRAHLESHLEKGTWCDVACSARTFFHRDTPMNSKKVRQRLRNLSRAMIRKERFLVVEYAPAGNGTHGEAQRFKIFEGKTPDEEQAAKYQLKKMWDRREISLTLYESAQRILKPVW